MPTGCAQARARSPAPAALVLHKARPRHALCHEPRALASSGGRARRSALVRSLGGRSAVAGLDLKFSAPSPAADVERQAHRHSLANAHRGASLTSARVSPSRTKRSFNSGGQCVVGAHDEDGFLPTSSQASGRSPKPGVAQPTVSRDASDAAGPITCGGADSGAAGSGASDP